MARTLVFSDDFNWHTTTAVLSLSGNSADWDEHLTSPSDNWVIQSSQVQHNSTTGARRSAQVAGQTFSADQYAKVQIAAANVLTNINTGVAVRMQPAGQTSENYYKLSIKDNGTTLAIEKYVAGSSSVINSVTITAPTVPFTLSLEVEGTTLRGYVNDTLEVTTTDTSFSTGVPGLFGFQADSSMRADNFEAGNVTTVTITPGIPSLTLKKDGVALGSLTGIKVQVVAGSELNGTSLYYTATATATAGVMDPIDLSSTAAAVSDPVVVKVLTAEGYGITLTTTVADIS